MENVKKVRTLRFFTKEELSILEPFVNGTEKLTFKMCHELAARFNRNAQSVYQYVHRKRKAANKPAKKQRFNLSKVKTDKTVARDKSVTTSTPMFKHGEFIIPVSSWEVRNNNGATSLVLKFEKSI
jgi:hypothetical protein